MKENLITARWRGIPVYLHWSVLLFLPWYWLQRHDLGDAVMALPAYVLLILVHEIGHALVARWRRTRVFAIRVLILHGRCEHAEPYYEEDDIWIAWGGVLAQAVLLVAALLLAPLLRQLPWPAQVALMPAMHVLVQVNVATIFLNLLPIAPLDGARAWRVLPRLPGLARRGRAVLGLRLRRLAARLQRLRPGRRRALRAASEATTADILRRLRDRA